jgi:hypothetical protein
MRTSPKPARLGQLKLFHPPAVSPSWQHLPWEIRQQTLHLLAQFLRESAGYRGAEAEPEVGDE